MAKLQKQAHDEADRLRRDKETYLQPLQEEEDVRARELAEFLFDFNKQWKDFDPSGILQQYPDVGNYLTILKVDPKEFWQRYLYRTDEARLIQRMQREREKQIRRKVAGKILSGQNKYDENGERIPSPGKEQQQSSITMSEDHQDDSHQSSTVPKTTARKWGSSAFSAVPSTPTRDSDKKADDEKEEVNQPSSAPKAQVTRKWGSAIVPFSTAAASFIPLEESSKPKVTARKWAPPTPSSEATPTVETDTSALETPVTGGGLLKDRLKRYSMNAESTERRQPQEDASTESQSSMGMQDRLKLWGKATSSSRRVTELASPPAVQQHSMEVPPVGNTVADLAGDLSATHSAHDDEVAAVTSGSTTTSRKVVVPAPTNTTTSSKNTETVDLSNIGLSVKERMKSWGSRAKVKVKTEGSSTSPLRPSPNGRRQTISALPSASMRVDRVGDLSADDEEVAAVTSSLSKPQISSSRKVVAPAPPSSSATAISSKNMEAMDLSNIRASVKERMQSWGSRAKINVKTEGCTSSPIPPPRTGRSKSPIPFATRPGGRISPTPRSGRISPTPPPRKNRSLRTKFDMKAAIAESDRRRKLKETYEAPLTSSDHEEQREISDFQFDFRRTYSKEQAKEQREGTLLRYPNSVAAFYRAVVPSEMSDRDFWERYNYRCAPGRILQQEKILENKQAVAMSILNSQLKYNEKGEVIHVEEDTTKAVQEKNETAAAAANDTEEIAKEHVASSTFVTPKLKPVANKEELLLPGAQKPRASSKRSSLLPVPKLKPVPKDELSNEELTYSAPTSSSSSALPVPKLKKVDTKEEVLSQGTTKRPSILITPELKHVPKEDVSKEMEAFEASSSSLNIPILKPVPKVEDHEDHLEYSSSSLNVPKLKPVPKVEDHLEYSSTSLNVPKLRSVPKEEKETVDAVRRRSSTLITPALKPVEKPLDYDAATQSSAPTQSTTEATSPLQFSLPDLKRVEKPQDYVEPDTTAPTEEEEALANIRNLSPPATKNPEIIDPEPVSADRNTSIRTVEESKAVENSKGIATPPPKNERLEQTAASAAASTNEATIATMKTSSEPEAETQHGTSTMIQEPPTDMEDEDTGALDGSSVKFFETLQPIGPDDIEHDDTPAQAKATPEELEVATTAEESLKSLESHIASAAAELEVNGVSTNDASNMLNDEEATREQESKISEKPGADVPLKAAGKEPELALVEDGKTEPVDEMNETEAMQTLNQGEEKPIVSASVEPEVVEPSSSKVNEAISGELESKTPEDGFAESTEPPASGDAPPAANDDQADSVENPSISMAVPNQQTNGLSKNARKNKNKRAKQKLKKEQQRKAEEERIRNEALLKAS